MINQFWRQSRGKRHHAKPKTVFARGIQHRITKSDRVKVLKSVRIELKNEDGSIYCFNSNKQNCYFTTKFALKAAEDCEKALAMRRITEPDTYTTFLVERYQEQLIIDIQCAVYLQRGYRYLAKHCGSKQICDTCAEVKAPGHICHTTRCPPIQITP